MKKYPADGARERARLLRRNTTDAERSIWQIMRSSQIGGHRFRRQVSFGPYIVDFVCHNAHLIIEIDGGQHKRSSPGEVKRTRFLKAQGYRILRFWNNDVLSNLEGVHETIVRDLTPTPTRPHRGGGRSLAICEPPSLAGGERGEGRGGGRSGGMGKA